MFSSPFLLHSPFPSSKRLLKPNAFLPHLLLNLFFKWAAGFEWQIHGNNGIFSTLHYDGRGNVATHLILN